MDTDRFFTPKIKRLIIVIVILVTLTLTASAQPADTPSPPEFTGNAEVEISGAVDSSNRYQWIVTVVGMLISGCIGPVVISQFKSRSERSEKSLAWAWESAERSKKELIKAKDYAISELRKELESRQETIERLRDRIDMIEDREHAAMVKISELEHKLSNFKDH